MSALNTHQPQFTNALINEKSPYLLQHAHNPVDWYAWNDETFAKARREDKPIFLSIGYATCHWCHVMERESFENEEIAAFLNEHFVAVKVDREERPDIDAMYMRVCQAMTGHGGWPLTIFMSPDKKPFFAGTYFPPANYRNRPGFPHILEQILHAWKHERTKVEESCNAILEHFSERTSAQTASVLPTNINDLAFQRYEQSFDPQYGGFGNQPKFPSPQNLLLLLRYYKRTGSKAALVMVERTLKAMRFGGIFDHIGYGFHRYSTDREWLVPHFEKMLYDQAMLAIAYLETHQATRQNESLYAQVAEEIFTYVLRDMTAPEGGFYSAEDADSEGHEGKFYVWSVEELRRIVGNDNAQLFAAAYNFREEGNFHDEATGAITGENIPHLRLSIEDYATQHSADVHELRVRLAVMREQLFYRREERIHPLKDDKILTDWNGLMIAAFAIGGRVLDNALYTQAAERALEFIENTMTSRTPDSTRLLHRYRDGEAAIPAFLDDYAFVAWGALELYQTTFAIKYLKTAIRFIDEMIRLFYDKADGAFRFSAEDNETLLLQNKEGYDGAIPSGNSIAANVMARLGKLTSNKTYQDLAERTIQRFTAQIAHHPTGFAQMLIANDFLQGITQEIIIAGKTGDNEMHTILRALSETYLPHAVIAFNHSPHELKHFIEQAEYQTALNNQATTYICENFVCQQPLLGSAALQNALST